jgi:hypothetical protein
MGLTWVHLCVRALKARRKLLQIISLLSRAEIIMKFIDQHTSANKLSGSSNLSKT